MSPVRYTPDPSREPAISGWFYPDRRRCLACRNCFRFLVIKRLWCSYECAGMAPPSSDPNDWPREHYTGGATRQEKTAYTHPGVVNAAQHRRDTIHLYCCSYCGMYHLGHRRVDG